MTATASRPEGSWTRALAFAALVGLAAGTAGCEGDEGDQGPAGPTGTAAAPPPTRTTLDPVENLPGVVLAITSVSGASGLDGTFQVGDKVSVTFTIKKRDGTALPLAEIDSNEILISGPTFNYQRVIAAQNDMKTRAVANADGSYTYTFATGLPATYLAPLNDSTAYGAGDGELAGQALLAGTYTVGFRMYKNYTVDAASFRDAASVTKDFLVKGATTIESRSAVAEASCNQCHVTLQAHGGGRRGVAYCLLCHTSGAEDRNKASVAGGTPGVSIDFKVMIHKIHSGKNLPSVMGVGTTDASGTRNYAVTPTAYRIVGFNDSIIDFSEVGFPVMPSAYVAYLFNEAGTTYKGTGGNGPMPRDTGHGALTSGQKLLEDKMRAGVVACEKCHGDPDGSGPLTKPAQGDLYKTQPSRASCGSCHDDIDWAKKYKSNGQVMPEQTNDSACLQCHAASGNTLATQDAHLHPYSNPALNTGVNINVTGVPGGTGAGGNFQNGDPIKVTFNVKNDAGTDFQVHKLTRFQMLVSGPVANPGIVLPGVVPYDTGFRKAAANKGNGTVGSLTVATGAVQQTIGIVFTGATTFDVIGTVSAPLAGQSTSAAVTYNGVTFTVTAGATSFEANDRFYFEVLPTAPSYTMNVPIDITTERLAAASSASQTASVANVPLYWGRHDVFEAIPTGSAVQLTDASAVFARFVAVNDPAGAGFAVGNSVVLDPGLATEEYVKIGRLQTADDVTGADFGGLDRVWFTSALRYAHQAGAVGSIRKVNLKSRKEGVAYTVTDPANGTIDLHAGSFSDGNAVVITYRSHGRFGYKPAPGAPFEYTFPPAAADSDDIDVTSGDWRGLPFVDGTYTVGLWAHKDFSVSYLSQPTATAGPDDTTYRMITPPATKGFLFGAATTVEKRAIISSGSNCNACHGDLQAHGNGRRGLETCLMCHSISGMEDAPKYTFPTWYIGATPGVGMEFRSLLHKVHMGKELTHPSSYVVNGVFLGVPYPVTYEGSGYPAMPGAVKHCEKCHGTGSTAFEEPSERQFPTFYTPPTQAWHTVCGSCHDSNATKAHMELQTSNGLEACETCHGDGKELSVEIKHKNR